jgi:hypothetical protein
VFPELSAGGYAGGLGERLNTDLHGLHGSGTGNCKGEMRDVDFGWTGRTNHCKDEIRGLSTAAAKAPPPVEMTEGFGWVTRTGNCIEMTIWLVEMKILELGTRGNDDALEA